MAHHKSAIKAMHQNATRRERNRQNIGRMRTTIKKLRAAIAAGDAKLAQELLPQTVSVIDKSIQKGVVASNAAARYKSRLTTHVMKLVAANAKS